MSRKALALLPVYMLAMLLAATMGLVCSIVLFIPIMIQPKIIDPTRKKVMQKFMVMFAQLTMRRMVRPNP